MPLSFGEVTPVITVNTIIPKMSSIIAAPNIDVPTFPFNFPISFNVSTEILTDVAVKITPTKHPFNKSIPVIAEERKNNKYTIVPPKNGTITPIKAMIKEAFPVFFNSSNSVSNPA